MRYFLITVLLFSSLTALAKDTQQCLNKGKEFFEQKEYSYAQKTLENCLKNNKNNVDILVSLGGICIKQNSFDQALNYFKEALKNMPKTSPNTAYVYERIADAYILKQDFIKAANYYGAVLNLEPENINALIGKGLCEEKKGNMRLGATYFKKALELDLTSSVAREHLIALEPDILEEEELLETLKERNILDPQTQTYQEQDLALLRKMLKAEKDKAITYLGEKYSGKIPSGLIVERYSGKPYARKMLSYSGYKDLMFLLSQDALEFFIKQGINKNEVLKLRDFNGNNIFDDKGFLTDEGLVAYSLSLNGQKAYLRISDPLPDAVKKAEMQVRQLVSQGYEEITTAEYAYLIEKSRCSEKTLVKNGVKIVPSSPGKNRFLIIDQAKKPSKYDCPIDTQVCFYNIVQEKRKEHKNSSKNTPVYTSTFGTGSVITYLCKEDGTLGFL